MSDWKRPDPIPLPRHFHSARCCLVVGKKIAVASFRGEAASRHAFRHVYGAIDEAISELLDAEMPAGLIFDLRELKYSWGDEMSQTLFSPNRWYGGAFPVVVIVSDLNREGLTSLVRDEMFEKPEEWLVETEEAAFRLMEIKLSSPPRNKI